MSFAEAEVIYSRFKDTPMRLMGNNDIRLWQWAMSALQNKGETTVTLTPAPPPSGKVCATSAEAFETIKDDKNG